MAQTSLKVGISCYPSIGGSGILATALGVELAKRGHEVHFVSYDRPVRLPSPLERTHFHPVRIHGYGIFSHADYTLPLSVKLAEVTRTHRLDILHAHYAVPHATAAVLAREFLPPELRPRVVTTLHGTDTMLLGRDEAYRPVLRHTLVHSDRITTVSRFLREETFRLVEAGHDIDVVPNFFVPRAVLRSRAEVRAELGMSDNQALVIHVSNLRPVKRIDLLLNTASRIRPFDSFRLLIIAGDDFGPFRAEVKRLGLEDRILVREHVTAVEEYIAAADLALITSEYESFCLSILEAMTFAVPSVSTAVGGIPEVIDHEVTGLLKPFGDAEGLAESVSELVADPAKRRRLGVAALERASSLFSAERVVSQYLDVYRSALSDDR